MIPDELIGNLGDVHIYLNQIEGCNIQINRDSFELPKLYIDNEYWDGPFHQKVFSDDFCQCLLQEDIKLLNYKSHDKIYFPLSN